MKKLTKVTLFFVIGILYFFNMYAGERTVPVDIFLMIDKSVSMQDPGKFDSLHKWVRDELIGQMLIPGDWITIYQFYEKPEEVLTLDVKYESSRQYVIDAINNIKPDGKFTDIGYALDTIQQSLDRRGNNGRFKVLLLVTDLEQDAPWTSKYRGKQDSFTNPYLAEARMIKRDNWFEVTLDMDIQDTVVQRTQSLYSDVISNDGKPRTGKDQSKTLITGKTKIVTEKDKKSDLNTNINNTTNTLNKTKDTDEINTINSTVTNNRNENTKNSIKDQNNDVNAISEANNNSKEIVATSNNTQDNEKQNKKVLNSNKKKASSNSNNHFTLFAGISILVLAILIGLILVVIRTNRKRQDKKETKKEKQQLI